MKYIIFTMKNRSIEYNRTYNRLLELGIKQEDIIIDFGFTHEEVPELKKNFHLLIHKFLTVTVPNMIDLNEDLVYLEDNVYPIKKLDDIDIDKNKINWLGYIFNNKTYICGNKYVYFPLEIMKDIHNLHIKSKIRYQHFDRFIRNYGMKNDKLVIGKNHIFLFQSLSCWGSDEQKKRKQKLKEKLFIQNYQSESESSSASGTISPKPV